MDITFDKELAISILEKGGKFRMNDVFMDGFKWSKFMESMYKEGTTADHGEVTVTYPQRDIFTYIPSKVDWRTFDGCVFGKVFVDDGNLIFQLEIWEGDNYSGYPTRLRHTSKVTLHVFHESFNKYFVEYAKELAEAIHEDNEMKKKEEAERKILKNLLNLA